MSSAVTGSLDRKGVGRAITSVSPDGLSRILRSNVPETERNICLRSGMMKRLEFPQCFASVVLVAMQKRVICRSTAQHLLCIRADAVGHGSAARSSVSPSAISHFCGTKLQSIIDSTQPDSMMVRCLENVLDFAERMQTLSG